MTALLLSALLLTAEDLRALGETDDVRYVARLEEALERRLSSEPHLLSSPDVEEEIVACLLAMARLDDERASAAARDALSRVSSSGSGSGSRSRSSRPYWAALRVLARAGDGDTIRRGLEEFFEAPDDWTLVLGEAATNDVRLADFLPGVPRAEGDRERRRRTRLARNLGLTIEEPLDGKLASVGSELDPRNGATFERALMALDPNGRFRLIRALAARDDEALVRLSLDGETLGRLSAYLARSRYPVVRSRLVAATRHRGRALASWLLSPRGDDDEKKRAVVSMRDAWAGALAESEADVYSVMSSLLGPEVLVERATREALARPPLPSARARLEELAVDENDAEAVRLLMTRDDRVLSLPVLYALERGSSEEVRREAERALLMLGAGGASVIARTGPEPPTAELVPLVLRSTFDVDGERALRLVTELASDPAPSPTALAALYALNIRRPELFIELLGREGEALVKRFHFVLSLAGDEERIPLLVDLAVTESPPSSREAAFIGLTEVELGPFDKRLHRLAGHPDRRIRFRAACALAPSGEPWVIRLLLADLDEETDDERSLARKALSRVEPESLRALLRAMVGDETASAFAVDFLLDLEPTGESRDERSLQRAMWERLRDGVEARRPLALEAASRLSERRARAAVTAYLEGL